MLLLSAELHAAKCQPLQEDAIWLGIARLTYEELYGLINVKWPQPTAPHTYRNLGIFFEEVKLRNRMADIYFIANDLVI